MQKAYEAPQLTKVGSLKDLTLGEGRQGHDDSWWFFHWGELS